MKKIINLILIAILIFLGAGIGTFIYNADHGYKVNKDFVSLPLQFDPDNASSTYENNNAQITVYGGFVKGIQKGRNNAESIIIRSLSPLPAIDIKGKTSGELVLLIENINPEFYAGSISSAGLPKKKLTPNTLSLSIELQPLKSTRIEPTLPNDANAMGKYKYVILGDNRDGYETFEQIIQQVNGQNPVFVIDNGDLVFSGKPNQYRLFDQLISKVSSTVCTTLGNHDIRDGGRKTYTMLYGPPYYSFDFGGSHYVFLDSSPGWSEKRAISDEQYAWLERDLARAKGKSIFVISHIPPHDPRSGVTKNEIPNYVNEVESGQNWAEQKLDNYNESKDMEHGFQDPQEAEKFESIMSASRVDTVYLSHIHSYLEYTRDGVRYLISGGAGAELLSKNSYYHYMITKLGNSDQITMVELPSPPNTYLARYGATVRLFASAMYKENPLAVILVLTSLGLVLLLTVIRIYLWKKRPFDTLGRWLADIGKYAVRRFRELFGKKTSSK